MKATWICGACGFTVEAMEIEDFLNKVKKHDCEGRHKQTKLDKKQGGGD